MTYEQTIEENKRLISTYKTSIDLVAFTESMGFQLNKKSSSRGYPVMEEVSSGRKLIISKDHKTGDFKYFNPNDTRDKGNIITLASEHYKLDLSTKQGWDDLHTKLSDIIGNHYMQNHDHIRPVRIMEIERPEALVKYFNLKPLTDTAWLENQRKISTDTIRAPAFVNKIFNKPFTDKKSQTSGVNTVFPVENEKGMIAIISRNTDWNMMVGQKSNGVWVSNIDRSQQLKEMVIFESPIDALSYHQLFPPKTPFERVYIATAGQPAKEQFATIQSLINKTNPEKLILANDNEPSGIRFNIRMMNRLIMPSQPVSGIHIDIANNKHTNTLLIDIDHRSVGTNPLLVEQLKAQINNTFNKGLSLETPKADIRSFTSRNDLTQMEVSFPNQRHLLIRAENLTKDLRQVGERILIRRSMEKDFNDDLKVKLANQEKQAFRQTQSTQSGQPILTQSTIGQRVKPPSQPQEIPKAIAETRNNKTALKP